METPYRLKALCQELKSFFPDWSIVFGYCLTTPGERVISGRIAEVIGEIQKLPKDEFVLFLVASS
jgi:16S rRNA C1402 (ribose-2'-O) methylase RsmI